jgi:hypothetical protein
VDLPLKTERQPIPPNLLRRVLVTLHSHLQSVARADEGYRLEVEFLGATLAGSDEVTVGVRMIESHSIDAGATWMATPGRLEELLRPPLPGPDAGGRAISE